MVMVISIIKTIQDSVKHDKRSKMIRDTNKYFKI